MMADTPKAAPKDAKASSDFGASQVRDAFAEAQEQGYFGQKVDPLPNSAHSLESGPEAPTASEQHATALKARADDITADAKKKGD
jgi:hypothetical protein